MFQDAGSDSAGSTSTKASSGTPAKPKGKKLDTELEATGKTPPPGKRVRAKMTPLPSAEKTPSTSTPLPKALKDATATPGRATPGKMHIEELASPDVLAKKTLEFDELEGTPARTAPLKMASDDSLLDKNETPADVRYVRQLLVEGDGSAEESAEDIELATQLTKDLSELALSLDETQVDESVPDAVPVPVPEMSTQAGAVEGPGGTGTGDEMSTQAVAVEGPGGTGTEMSTEAGEMDGAKVSEEELKYMVAKLADPKIRSMLLRPNTVDFESMIEAAKQSMPPPSYIPVKAMPQDVVAKALSEAAALPPQSSQASALPPQSSQAAALPPQSSQAAVLPPQTTELPSASEPPTPSDSEAELLEAQAAAKEEKRRQKNQRASCPLAVMEAYGECLLPNGRVDRAKMNRLFDDWASHGENWGDTEVYAQWESKQLNRQKESCRWLTRKEIRTRYGYTEEQVAKLCGHKDGTGEWRWHPDFPADE
ncbi:unnamed protein product, partial [Symbiodinium sp. KB8]